MRLDAHAAWRAVLVYSGDPAVADAVAGTEPRPSGGNINAAEVIDLLDVAQRQQRSAGATIAVIDFTAIEGMSDRHRRTLDRLMDLVPPDRRLVAAHHVAGIPIDRLESLLPGARQRLAVLEPALEREPETALAEIADLADLRPLEAAGDGRPFRWAVPVVAAVLTVGAAAAAVTWPPAVTDEETAPGATAPNLATTTTTAPDLAQLVTDPDRQIHLEMTPDHEVVRRLATGEVIWTAGPFRDAEVISVELDTVVILNGSRRLKLSLVDGTLLPP